jgi:dihydrofolate reductase
MRAIVAMASNRVIGDGARIPWHLPDDFKWFKLATIGQNLLMGRTTFEAIGKPLPGRFTYILTNNQAKINLPSAKLCTYVGESWVDDLSPELDESLWLCGGAKVYEKFLPKCSEVYVTHVIGDFEGDVFMPPFEHMFPNSELQFEHKDFWVVKHSR